MSPSECPRLSVDVSWLLHAGTVEKENLSIIRRCGSSEPKADDTPTTGKGNQECSSSRRILPSDQ